MTKKKTHRGRLQAQGVTRLKFPRLRVKVSFNALETWEQAEPLSRNAGLLLHIHLKPRTDAKI